MRPAGRELATPGLRLYFRVHDTFLSHYYYIDGYGYDLMSETVAFGLYLILIYN